MSTLQVQLRDDLRQLAEQRAAEGGYKDVVEYVEALIESGISDEGDLEIDGELESLLLKRLETGGPSIRVTPEVIQNLKTEIARGLPR